jgi:hypothetical protein
MRTWKAVAMSGVVLSFGLVACSPPAAAPPTPAPITKTRGELAQEAFDLSGQRQQIVQAMRAGFMQLVNDPRMAGIVDEEIKLAADKMATEAVGVFAQEFTAQELSDMIAFFNSPSGKSYLLKQPTIGEKMGPIGQRIGEEMGRKIVERIQAAGLSPTGGPPQ